MTTIVAGTCNCGTEMSRERAEGFGAHLLNAMPFICSACSAREEAERAAEDGVKQAQLDRERLAQKLEALPAALRSARLVDLDVDGRTTALAAARRWATGELEGVVLLGPIGVGKTTIAAATVVEYASGNLHRSTPRWINTVQALNDLSRGFNDRRRLDAMDALDAKKSPLVLDDIDKAKPNANAAAILFGAIDSCMTRRRQLLVTTNLMPSQLAANWPKPYGEAIASRLAGYCEMHRLTGSDRRLRPARQQRLHAVAS
jgi:DNA replication protein DnaC